MKQNLFVGVCIASLSSVSVAQFDISIGVRETHAGGGTFTGVGDDGGISGGIEWINRDGQTLALDGTWQTFSFTFATDPVLAFAGSTANSILEGAFGTLEHVRILNNNGITAPVRLWIDEIQNDFTITGGPPTSVTFGDFESFAPGQEVIFRAPGLSGSTTSNILPGSTALVTDMTAHTGSHSNQLDFQFVDATPTRWVRLTTFDTANLPNPLIRFDGGSVLTFQMRGEVVPEPATMVVLGLGSLSLLARRRKKR